MSLRDAPVTADKLAFACLYKKIALHRFKIETPPRLLARAAGRPALIELRTDPEVVSPRATIASLRKQAAAR